MKKHLKTLNFFKVLGFGLILIGIVGCDIAADSRIISMEKGQSIINQEDATSVLVEPEPTDSDLVYPQISSSVSGATSWTTKINITDPDWYKKPVSVDQLRREQLIEADTNSEITLTTILEFKSDLSDLDKVTDLHVSLQFLYGSASAKYNCIYIYNYTKLKWEKYCEYLPWETPYMMDDYVSAKSLEGNVKDYISNSGVVKFQSIVQSDPWIQGCDTKPGAVRERIDMAAVTFMRD